MHHRAVSIHAHKVPGCHFSMHVRSFTTQISKKLGRCLYAEFVTVSAFFKQLHCCEKKAIRKILTKINRSRRPHIERQPNNIHLKVILIKNDQRNRNSSWEQLVTKGSCHLHFTKNTFKKNYLAIQEFLQAFLIKEKLSLKIWSFSAFSKHLCP